MAVVSRIARVRVISALGGFREYSATAAVQDTASGSSVAVTVAETTGGTAPPDAPNQNIELNFYVDNGSTLIRTVTFSPGSLPQVATFFFTANGLTGGAARLGTVRMRVRMEKTNGGPTATYHVDSDGTNNTPPTAGSSEFDQGWIRGTATATVTASNISAGGGKIEPAKFAESLFHRAVVSAQSYAGYTLAHTFSGTSKTLNTTGTGSTRDATFSGTSIASGRVNEGFPADDASYTATVAVGSNSTLTGLPWTVITVTPDSLQVDPRITAVHLFQLDDNSFGTPPLAKDDNANERPSSSIGYLATGFHDARGGVAGNVLSGGVNGLTVDISLTAPNGDEISRTATTASQGGEDGWTEGFMQWTSPLPGGSWDKLVDITSPSDIDGSGYLLNATDAIILIASRSPFVHLICDVGHADGSATDRHLHNGDSIEVNLYLKKTKLGEQVLLAADTTNIVPQVSLERVRGNEVQVYDPVTGLWADTVDGALIFTDCTQVSDCVWRFVATSDADWSDVVVNAIAQFDGVQYDAVAFREFVGNSFHHDRDESQTIGIVSSVYSAGGSTRQRRHLRESGDDLELILIPRDASGPDSTVEKVELAMRRVRTGSTSQDLVDPAAGPWIELTDAGHPNSGDLIFNEITLLPSGAGIVRIPEAVLDLAGNNVPWIIALTRMTFDVGQLNERSVIQDIQIHVYAGTNPHDDNEFDAVGIFK